MDLLYKHYTLEVLYGVSKVTYTYILFLTHTHKTFIGIAY